MKRMGGPIVVVSVLLLSFLASVAQTPSVQLYTGDRTQLRDIPSFVGWVPNEIIVKFNARPKTSNGPSMATGRTGMAAVDALGEKYQATRLERQFHNGRAHQINGREVDFATFYRVTFDAPADPELMAAEYAALADVESAEPIGIHTIHATPNDTNYPSQWHLNQANDSDVDAPEAWDVETGSPSIIAVVLDSGVRYFHHDLGGSAASYSTPTNADGNVWINAAEKNGVAGVDDDGNGFVDDWVGWDFVNGATACWPGEDCNTQDNDPRDFNGHGTHCAGNIAAINNNGYATAAVSGGWGNGTLQPTANGVKVMCVRTGWSGNLGGQEVGYVRMDFCAAGFYYAADNGARIASCSWGSSNSGGIGAAADYFLSQGGLIFKSAGNNNNQSADYLGGRADIITVAASDQNDCKSSFSSYGTWVDVTAPGTSILSLYHNHNNPSGDYVAYVSGTSMATPITASVAALIWSQNPGWTPAQVRNQLETTCDPIDGLACNSAYVGKLGAGRVNAFAAVSGGCTLPVAEFSGSPTSGTAPLAVDFTDLSTGADNWYWNFGDGNTSMAQNPQHIYSSAGTYTVTLEVNNACGWDVETKTNYITVTPGGGNVVGEVGIVVRNQTGNGADWYTVNTNTYTNAVVVMKGLSTNGGHKTHLRVRNIGSSSFEWQMEEWDYHDGNHITEDNPYIVMEAGVHSLDGGATAEAGKASVGTGWQTVNFSAAFSGTPTLLVGVASDNDNAAVVARTRNLTATSFQVRLQEEEAADGIHANETVSWIAIGQGTGTNNGNNYHSGRTANAVTHQNYNIGLTGFSSTPIFLCHDDTFDGGNTCSTRYRTLNSTTATVFIEEEQSLDEEINHISEVVSFLAWAGAGDITSSGSAGPEIAAQESGTQSAAAQKQDSSP